MIVALLDVTDPSAQASGAEPRVLLDSITERVSIRNSVQVFEPVLLLSPTGTLPSRRQNGEIHAAIEQVNDLDPEILETSPRPSPRIASPLH